MMATLASASLRENNQIARACASPPFAKSRKDERGGNVDTKRCKSNDAHHIRIGRHGIERSPKREAKDAQTERAQKQTLGKGDLRTRGCCPAQRDETDKRDRTITDKVERVRLQGLAIGDKSQRWLQSDQNRGSELRQAKAPYDRQG